MHELDPQAAAVPPPGVQARQAGAAWLEDALLQSRQDTLATFALYEAARPGLQVPQDPALNPPLWELGHIGWFQDWWLRRNPQRDRGLDADPDAQRLPPARPGADALYHSGRVPHASRWQLPLPDADATRADLEGQLAHTRGLLRAWADADPADEARSLYFFRLALLHEDMHHEAALYMAQALGVAVPDPRWQARPLPAPPPPLHFDAGPRTLGSPGAAGFAFDNEQDAHAVDLPATVIDAQVLRWTEYLPFVEAGGYTQDRWWTEAGRAWKAAGAVVAPRYLKRVGAAWLQGRHGRWQALRLDEAACHLTQHEALAWCRWAGRRLPTEAEWERAAVTRGSDFLWGDVWEWTASPFAPYPGFRAHPYRDYSAPWFDGRPVLRGASFMTQPRMRHPRYRNYFLPERNDLAVGFRSCAL